MPQKLRAHITLAEEFCFQHPRQATHNGLHLQSQGIQPFSVLCLQTATLKSTNSYIDTLLFCFVSLNPPLFLTNMGDKGQNNPTKVWSKD